MKDIALAGLVFIVSCLTMGTRLNACSSCGSGGADPVLIYPNEQIKTYFSLTDQRGFRDIRSDGNTLKSYGVESKQILSLGAAMRLTERAFGSLITSYQWNRKQDRQQSAWNDPSLNLRYTVLRQNFMTPMLPQIQFIGTYKPSLARDINESTDRYGLDVFGNGFTEYRLGMDTWFGMKDWVWGGSWLYTFPSEKDTRFGLIEKGPIHTLILTAGYLWVNQLKVISGVILRREGGIRTNGTEVASSQVEDNGQFLTIETLFRPDLHYRVNILRQAAFGQNTNTSRFDSLNLAILWTVQ